ncbi:MAG TPA: hydrogenase expression/formation protein HypE [Streptosporangiaceae bacterium]|nr:hydrogenase expression/formation protein HypE [Streptosporangiaceae bacterium]
MDPLTATCPMPQTETERVLLGHGSGGRLMAELLAGVIEPELGLTGPAEDAAVVDLGVAGGHDEVIVSTDAFVVTPRVFPGGDIGELAVNGTVNDLAMRGARPVGICLSYIVEEGLGIEELRTVTASVARAARSAGVRVVSGDTKVVGRGAADGLYVTTTGFGLGLPGARISAANAQPEDVVLISGPIGLHGTAILSVRENLGFEAEIASDTRPLHDLVAAMVDAGGVSVHALRDPTRGGLASALNELAETSAVGVELDESAIPVPGTVAAACDLLGLDPLHVANEGCLVAFVSPEAALDVLVAMRAHPAGHQARPIGRAVAAHPGRVRMYTTVGATRVVDMLVGEQLPRIC